MSEQTTTGPTSPAFRLSSFEAEATAAVLAAEHQAVYAYGVIGAWTTGQERQRAIQQLDRHTQRRDEIAARLSSAGSTPAAAKPGYRLPFEIESRATAVALAAMTERAVAQAIGQLLTAVPAERRLLMARWLADAAQAATAWDGRSDAFPGWTRPR
ncbi:MAG: ferritin-like domain-containing protein [Angustibacter sp.]